MRYFLLLIGIRSLLKRVSFRLVTGFIISLHCMWSSAEIQVKDAYVRGLPPGQPVTAAFMRLYNTGDKPVEIIAANSDSANRAEIHAHLHRDGMMRMEKVESVIVPAGGELIMEPGGYHLMLLELHKPLREGDTVNIQLQVTSGENISAQLPVRSVLNEHKHKHH